MSNMLWVLDVGNTHTVTGLFDKDKLTASWRISTDKDKTTDEYGLLFKNILSCHDFNTEELKGLCLSCVVPPLIPTLEQMAEKYFHLKPVTVSPGVKTGISIEYENPKEVGADRIANAAAVHKYYGGPSVVVDMGTATTFDIISEKGSYIGGVIAPGITISTEALFDRTAKLPRVELIYPPHAIGRNTIHSMQSGITYGFLGQIEGILKKINDELTTPPRVIATGGLAEKIAGKSSLIDEIDPFLTLKGLQIIYSKNEGSLNYD